MTTATITFDPYRLREVLTQEMDNHRVHPPSGQCSCGQPGIGDPERGKQHMADALMSVILRFQGAGPAPKEPAGDERLRALFVEHYGRLYTRLMNMPYEAREQASIHVPMSWGKSGETELGTVFGGVPVLLADVEQPEVYVPKPDRSRVVAQSERPGDIF